MPRGETKICQATSREFALEAADLALLEQFGVPAPSFAPQYRHQVRMAFSNERSLYKRTCDATGESILSIYPADTIFPVYQDSAWKSDSWDAHDYGRPIDWGRPLLEQFYELKQVVPRVAVIQQGNMVDSPYTNRVSDLNNCYLVFRASRCENCVHSYWLMDCRDCMDCFAVTNCEFCYECIDCDGCHRVRFGQESRDCRDCWFVYDCVNCSDCVGCVNLRNAQYQIFNQQYSKEEYKAKLAELGLDSRQKIAELRSQFDEFRQGFPHRYRSSVNAINSTGNWLSNCTDVTQSFMCGEVEHARHCFAIRYAKDCMDVFHFGFSSELIYSSANIGLSCSSIKFSNECFTSCSDLEYCDHCVSSQNCFLCIGMNRGEYCILNQQYSKEKYLELLPKLRQHMTEVPYHDENGWQYQYGDFFPASFSPFAYNETAAQQYFPIGQASARNIGFRWHDPEMSSHAPTVAGSDLPDSHGGVTGQVLQEVIACSESNRAYRIVQSEWEFYQRMQLPVSEFHPDIRHEHRLAQRNPIQLWQRTTADGVEVETSFAPDRPERILSEEGFQQQVL